MSGPSEVSRQMSNKSRSIDITQGGGSYLGGGGQTTSRTSNNISTFEKNGRGEHISKTGSDSHTVRNISRREI